MMREELSSLQLSLETAKAEFVVSWGRLWVIVACGEGIAM